MQLTPQQIEQGRVWLRDCTPAPGDIDMDPDCVPVPWVESEIRRQYPGGIDCFLAAGELPIRGADAAD
jgi:hypothetical protein